MNRINASSMIFVILLSTLVASGQKTESFDFIGTISVGDTLPLTYRLVLDISQGRVYGYTLTDFQGQHETKTILKGTYDYTNGQLEFIETELVYTKSIYQTHLCYVVGHCTLSSKNKRAMLIGSFEGKYSNDKHCASGSISMVSASYIVKGLKRAEKLAKALEKDTLGNQVKSELEKIDYKKTTLSNNQSIKYKWQSRSAELWLWDQGLEDGDKINLRVNGMLICNNYRLVNQKKRIPIVLSKPNNIIEIEATSTGTSFPNTATLMLSDGSSEFELVSVLNQGQKARIVLVLE